MNKQYFEKAKQYSEAYKKVLKVIGDREEVIWETKKRPSHSIKDTKTISKLISELKKGLEVFKDDFEVGFEDGLCVIKGYRFRMAFEIVDGWIYLAQPSIIVLSSMDINRFYTTKINDVVWFVITYIIHRGYFLKEEQDAKKQNQKTD